MTASGRSVPVAKGSVRPISAGGDRQQSKDVIRHATWKHRARDDDPGRTTPAPTNPNTVITEQIIPPEVGGEWIREIGLNDVDGDLVAVATEAAMFNVCQLKESKDVCDSVLGAAHN